MDVRGARRSVDALIAAFRFVCVAALGAAVCLGSFACSAGELAEEIPSAWSVREGARAPSRVLFSIGDAIYECGPDDDPHVIVSLERPPAGPLYYHVSSGTLYLVEVGDGLQPMLRAYDTDSGEGRDVAPGVISVVGMTDEGDIAYLSEAGDGEPLALIVRDAEGNERRVAERVIATVGDDDLSVFAYSVFEGEPGLEERIGLYYTNLTDGTVEQVDSVALRDAGITPEAVSGSRMLYSVVRQGGAGPGSVYVYERSTETTVALSESATLLDTRDDAAVALMSVSPVPARDYTEQAVLFIRGADGEWRQTEVGPLVEGADVVGWFGADGILVLEATLGAQDRFRIHDMTAAEIVSVAMQPDMAAAWCVMSEQADAVAYVTQERPLPPTAVGIGREALWVTTPQGGEPVLVAESWQDHDGPPIRIAHVFDRATE